MAKPTYSTSPDSNLQRQAPQCPSRQLYSGNRPACSIVSKIVLEGLDSMLISLLILSVAITARILRSHLRELHCQFDPQGKKRFLNVHMENFDTKKGRYYFQCMVEVL